MCEEPIITDEELEEMHTLSSNDIMGTIKLFIEMLEPKDGIENDMNYAASIEKMELKDDKLTLTFNNGQVFLLIATQIGDDPSKRQEEKESFRKFCEEEEAKKNPMDVVEQLRSQIFDKHE